jgi:hypothetical protein
LHYTEGDVNAGRYAVYVECELKEKVAPSRSIKKEFHPRKPENETPFFDGIEKEEIDEFSPVQKRRRHQVKKSFLREERPFKSGSTLREKIDKIELEKFKDELRHDYHQGHDE